jgi:hypothetical protein
LERDPEYVKGDSFQADLAEHARKHEGQLRFWSLVGRLDADELLGSDAPGVGAMALLHHQGPQLLRALEDPVNRGVWETLWAAVMRCDEEMAYGQWGSHNLERLAEFNDAARKIVGDARVSLLWRGRFAVRALPPNVALLISCTDYVGGAQEGKVMSMLMSLVIFRWLWGSPATLSPRLPSLATLLCNLLAKPGLQAPVNSPDQLFYDGPPGWYIDLGPCHTDLAPL